MVLLAGIVTVSWMLPVPEPVNPDAPPFCDAVKVTPVRRAGKLSVTTAPMTLLGPGLETTIVKVSFAPAMAPASVTVTLRSALNVIVEVSVAVLLAGFGSFIPIGPVTVAVLEIVPVADEGINPVAR